jgi:hypothetical protein
MLCYPGGPLMNNLSTYSTSYVVDNIHLDVLPWTPNTISKVFGEIKAGKSNPGAVFSHTMPTTIQQITSARLDGSRAMVAARSMYRAVLCSIQQKRYRSIILILQCLVRVKHRKMNNTQYLLLFRQKLTLLSCFGCGYS